MHKHFVLSTTNFPPILVETGQQDNLLTVITTGRTNHLKDKTNWLLQNQMQKIMSLSTGRH